MKTKLVVAIIHGMGEIEANYADSFIRRVSKTIADKAISDSIKFIPIHWGDVTQPKQTDYFRRAGKQSKWRYKIVRRFILSALGDAAAYQRLPHEQDSTYKKIHKKIESELDIEVDADTPVVFVAHSLGAHMLSNYIWDKQQSPNDQHSDYLNLKTMAGFITMGCNIPLFCFAADEPQPIAFPGEALPESLRENAKWLNYFDKDDVLGYPLRTINKQYRQVVTEDIAVNIGSFFRSWNPFSHDVYWHDKDIINPVANYLKELTQRI